MINEEKNLIGFEKEFIKSHKKNFSEIPKLEENKQIKSANVSKSTQFLKSKVAPSSENWIKLRRKVDQLLEDK